jgi:stage V sporulation protein R
MRTIAQKDIQKIQPEITSYAKEYGLDFFPIIFELVDYETMNQLAAYGGFPIRYPHWRFGMKYDQLIKGYRYGLQKIYEMVINTKPCYAYLMNVNSIVDQKLLVAHVIAHGDFFKNNYYFSPTNRKMIDEMANHATRVGRYIDRFGLEKIENFIDTCLSLENLIDNQSLYITRKGKEIQKNYDSEKIAVKKLRSKKYMDRFINPPEILEKEKEQKREKRDKQSPYPRIPERDILLFLIENAPLKEWQRDILGIIREEAYYFAPQAMTKIMNEGWATYWHSTILPHRVLHPKEIVDYADHHSGTVASYQGKLNPYRLGVMLYKDIEERWNKGKFGREYEECDDIKLKKTWDKQLGLGRQKIFEVRKFYNDVNFIDTFLTEDFCREHNLFSFAYNRERKRYEIESREFEMIKKRLLNSLTNTGQPIIEIQDANYLNRNELYLLHRFEDIELDHNYAVDTLKNLQTIWNRPVHIQTVLQEKSTILSFNRKVFQKKEI